MEYAQHWSGRHKEPDGGAERETETERCTNGRTAHLRVGGERGDNREPQPRPPTPSELLPWICDRQLRHLQLQRDEGTPCPGPSGRGPQPLREAAPQDCPPSCEMPGPCRPGLPAEGQPGLLCWPLGAEGSQETSGRDRGSSPGKRKGGKVQSLGQGDGAGPSPGEAARVEATHRSGAAGKALPCPQASPTSVWHSPPQLPHSPSPTSDLSGELSLLHPRVQLFYGPLQSPKRNIRGR